MASYRASAYGPNPNAGVNVNADHGWGGYQFPAGVPSSLLGTAQYGNVRSQVRKELVTLYSLAYRIAKDKHGYTIHSENPNGNGEPWGPWGYENRTISGSSTPSNHSKGKANDWNAPNNGYANGFANITSDFPPAMVADLESIGLCWGGRYGDAMHWEYGYSPADVAGHEAKARSILGQSGTGTAPDKPEDWFDMASKDDLKAAIREMLPEIQQAVWDSHFEETGGGGASVGDIVGATLRESRDFRGEVNRKLDEMPTSVWIKEITPERANVLLARAAGPSPASPPPPAGTYTVKSGDSFNAIAAAHGLAPDALAAANPQVKDRNQISPGDVLTLPK